MFQKMICHRYFSYFGNLVALINVALIAVSILEHCTPLPLEGNTRLVKNVSEMVCQDPASQLHFYQH